MRIYDYRMPRFLLDVTVLIICPSTAGPDWTGMARVAPHRPAAGGAAIGKQYLIIHIFVIGADAQDAVHITIIA